METKYQTFTKANEPKRSMSLYTHCNRLMQLIAQGDVTVFDNADTGIFEAIEKQLEEDKIIHAGRVQIAELTRNAQLVNACDMLARALGAALNVLEISRPADPRDCAKFDRAYSRADLALTRAGKVVGSLSESLAPCPQREQPQ